MKKTLLIGIFVMLFAVDASAAGPVVPTVSTETFTAMLTDGLVTSLRSIFSISLLQKSSNPFKNLLLNVGKSCAKQRAVRIGEKVGNIVQTVMSIIKLCGNRDFYQQFKKAA